MTKCLFITMCLLWASNHPPNHGYAEPVCSAVWDLSQQYGYDPVLMAAQVWVESAWKPTIQHPRSKATGPMQVKVHIIRSPRIGGSHWREEHLYQTWSGIAAGFLVRRHIETEHIPLRCGGRAKKQLSKFQGEELDLLWMHCYSAGSSCRNDTYISKARLFEAGMRLILASQQQEWVIDPYGYEHQETCQAIPRDEGCVGPCVQRVE